MSRVPFWPLHSSGNLSRQYLSSTDNRNPLRIFRFAITTPLFDLAQKLAGSEVDPHAAVMRIMEYLSLFSVDLSIPPTPDATIAARAGSCGSLAGTMLALCTALGLNARFVNLYNYPPGDGHTVAEVWVKGEWRLYDPTFGAFYFRADDPSGSPLSFHQIRELYRHDLSVSQSILVRRPGHDVYTSRECFLKADPAGPIGPEWPMVFPQKLHLSDSPILDRHCFGPHFQGADWLGAAATNQNHRWRLGGLHSGTEYAFILTPGGIGGDRLNILKVFRLSARVKGGKAIGRLERRFNFLSGSARPWEIRFLAEGSDAEVELMHDYGGPSFRYMHMARYELQARNLGKA